MKFYILGALQLKYTSELFIFYCLYLLKFHGLHCIFRDIKMCVDRLIDWLYQNKEHMFIPLNVD